MTALQFGIIGCQHAHIKQFIVEMMDLGHRCVGIYEPNRISFARSIADPLGIPLVNNMEMLLGPEIAIIGSAGVNSEKIKIAELCAIHGKHIMIDKPAVTSREGLNKLKSIINQGKIQIGMMLTERFNPPIYTLKQHIDRGIFGQLVSVSTRKPHLLNALNRPPWFFSREQCGSIIVDLFIHDFDLLHWFTGEQVASMHGSMGKSILPEYPSFYDVADMQIVMDNGVIAHLYADWHTKQKSWTWGDGRIFVTGTEGFAELRLSGDPFSADPTNTGMMLQITNEQAPVRVKLEKPPVTLTEDFLNRIEGKGSVLTHDDILTATEWTITADERTQIMNIGG